MEDMAKVHRFPWKSDFFKEFYHSLIIQLTDNLMLECISLRYCSNPRLLIDNIHKKLPLIMLKAARKAKKKTGSGTRNVLLRGRFVHCRRSPEILRTISNLKLLGRGKSEAEREQVTQSNRRFRFLQRRTIYDCERYKSDVVYRLLRDDRLTFWNRVRSVRFNSYKRANIIDSKPKPKEFFNFSKDCSHTMIALLTNGTEELS